MPALRVKRPTGEGSGRDRATATASGRLPLSEESLPLLYERQEALPGQKEGDILGKQAESTVQLGLLLRYIICRTAFCRVSCRCPAVAIWDSIRVLLSPRFQDSPGTPVSPLYFKLSASDRLAPLLLRKRWIACVWGTLGTDRLALNTRLTACKRASWHQHGWKTTGRRRGRIGRCVRSRHDVSDARFLPILAAAIHSVRQA